jgi:gas vesicle protein
MIMKDKGSMIGLVLLGFAAGAAVGILMAPDKGSETRKKLMGGIKDLAGNMDLDKLKQKLAGFGFQDAEEVPKDFYENAHSDSNPA